MSILQKVIKRINEKGIYRIAKDTSRYIARYLLRKYAVMRVGVGKKYTYKGVTIYPKGLHPNIKGSIGTESMDNGTIELIDEYLPKDVAVIEVGGGIGIVSCYIDKHIDKSVVEIVLEANKKILPRLEKHREENGAYFDIISKAYEPNGRRTTLYTGNQFWSTSTVKDQNRKMTKVDGISISGIVTKFNIKQFSLVTNCEGAEFELIHNEIDVLRDKCNTMIIGFHNVDEFDIGDTVKYITKNGFRYIEKKGKKKFLFKNNEI